MTKTRYEVWANNKLAYFFTTTIRNCEDCINIMVERFGKKYKTWKMFQIIDGVKKLVHAQIANIEPRKVRCLVTGNIYLSSKDYARAMEMEYSSVRRQLAPNSTMINKTVEYVDGYSKPVFDKKKLWGGGTGRKIPIPKGQYSPSGTVFIHRK